MTPRWDFRSVLDVDPDGDRGCVGTAKTYGRRCKNPISVSNRGTASRILDQMDRCKHFLSSLDYLRELAGLMLCKGVHNNTESRAIQVNKVEARWGATIRQHYAALKRRQEKAASRKLRRKLAIVREQAENLKIEIEEDETKSKCWEVTEDLARSAPFKKAAFKKPVPAPLLGPSSIFRSSPFQAAPFGSFGAIQVFGEAPIEDPFVDNKSSVTTSNIFSKTNYAKPTQAKEKRDNIPGPLHTEHRYTRITPGNNSFDRQNSNSKQPSTSLPSPPESPEVQREDIKDGKRPEYLLAAPVRQATKVGQRKSQLDMFSKTTGTDPVIKTELPSRVGIKLEDEQDPVFILRDNARGSKIKEKLLDSASHNGDALNVSEGKPSTLSLADELSESGEGESESYEYLEAELKSAKHSNQALILYINKLMERPVESNSQPQQPESESKAQPEPPSREDTDSRKKGCELSEFGSSHETPPKQFSFDSPISTESPTPASLEPQNLSKTLSIPWPSVEAKMPTQSSPTILTENPEIYPTKQNEPNSKDHSTPVQVPHVPPKSQKPEKSKGQIQNLGPQPGSQPQSPLKRSPSFGYAVIAPSSTHKVYLPPRQPHSLFTPPETPKTILLPKKTSPGGDSGYFSSPSPLARTRSESMRERKILERKPVPVPKDEIVKEKVEVVKHSSRGERCEGCGMLVCSCASRYGEEEVGAKVGCISRLGALARKMVVKMKGARREGSQHD